MNPAGTLDFKGLSAEILFFGEFQEQTGLKMEVVRHGRYKSAVEPFLGNEMSPENREQVAELLESLWGNIRQEISEGRGLPADSLDGIANSVSARTPQGAVRTGLVDALLYRDQYLEKLLDASGSDAEEVPIVHLQDYIRGNKSKRLHTGDDRIAVVYAQGEIIYGDGGPDFIGHGKMQEVLREIQDDDRIKAVVLRINSPGGSALSSEIIWREIKRTAEKKPVVVSLSDVAASGGYYMAVAGDRILAEPTTITGSIGVFVTIPNISGLADKVGINAEQVGTHELSADYSLFEPLSPEFREVLRDGIEESYQGFLKCVAEGRNMSLAQADSLAQGRIWSGEDAVRLGLADALGGMPEALQEAADLADLESYRLQLYPKYKSGLERLMEDLGGAGVSSGQNLLEKELGADWVKLLGELRGQLRREGLQARLPYSLEIR